IGARDRTDAQRVAKQSLIIAAIFSAVIALAGPTLGQQIIALMGTEPAVAQLGGSFMSITSLFALSLAVMIIGGGTLRGAGDTRTPMLITGTVNLINILLDYGLVFGNLGFPRLGAIGSAWATSLARTIGAVLILYVLFRRSNLIRLDWRHEWGIRKSTIARILNIGWPSAAEQIIFQLGFLAFSTIVVGLGTADYAAMQVAFNIAGWSNLPAFAFGVAALTLVGQSLGANDVPRAEASGKQALKNALVWMCLMGAIFIIWRRQFFALYTGDVAVQNLGTMIMLFIALAQPLQAVAIVLASALRGAGDTRAPMIFTTIGVWGVRVTVGYLLGIVLGLGLFGVWLGWMADFMTRAVLVWRRYHAGRWKKIRV
ncbi:MAG: MATE family efflux transporter, partial [Rudaea sp.]